MKYGIQMDSSSLSHASGYCKYHIVFVPKLSRDSTQNECIGFCRIFKKYKISYCYALMFI